MGTIIKGVAITFGLLIVAGAIGAMTGGTPEESPAAARTSAPATPTMSGAPYVAPPTRMPNPVRLQASAIIIPVEEFPLSGYKVANDTGDETYWRRTFDPLARIGAEYGYIDVAVTVHVSPDNAQAALQTWGCVADAEHAGTIGDAGPVAATLVSAPAHGELSHACAYAFEGGDAKFDYIVTTRNALIWVQVSPMSFSVAQSDALDQAVAIALRQMEIINRVSPP